MVSEARTIELTIVSATDLKNLQKFGRAQRCYAVAYIYAAQRQATHTDSSRGINPIWNDTMTLTCYESDLHPDGSANGSASSSSSSSSGPVITIDIYSHGSGIFNKGDRHLGTVVVPLQYIASAMTVEGLSMTLDVHRPSGKPRGKLNMVVKLGEKRPLENQFSSQFSGQFSEQVPYYSYYDKVEPSPVMPRVGTAYSVASGTKSIQGVYDQSKFDNEVVTGYPAASYGFAPLGQLPLGNEPQVTARQPYIPEVPVTRKEMKRARRARKAAMDPVARQARRRRRRNLAMMVVGGIVLGLILL